MYLQQKISAIILSIGLLVLIFELVRRKRLREEYSWLWMLLGTAGLLFAVWYDLLVGAGSILGIVAPTSTLLYFGLLFLVLICLQFSVRISTLTNQVTQLAQQLAVLKAGPRSSEKAVD